ncbi:hypothetical protein MUK42_28461 [Musa troglodytarum]|uniref:Uncharacterized protein n=1 Tax=Musa troglodytarum TaxID=320322 RepID=A0A9E7G045_9LILI|nr:hypothetical protein MUK42_28461 [Musa troglodytarum]
MEMGDAFPNAFLSCRKKQNGKEILDTRTRLEECRENSDSSGKVSLQLVGLVVVLRTWTESPAVAIDLVASLPDTFGHGDGRTLNANPIIHLAR